ncbi:SRPBCC family protein [Dactylosporangium sp. NPDC051541]|uniref:SRPBCC family protein n=1 Tax=Dactylosporangium sp. NPDC051541 TaxID=3363977 RepID=UPI0037A6C11C
MATESRHISVHIRRTPAEVYEYAVDPARLPEWAPGLCSAVERDGDRWWAISGTDRIELTFAPANALGVLDHDVHLPTGEVFHNPFRVIPHDEGSELVFTLRRQPGMSDADFTRDTGLVLADLEALKRIVEAR